MVKTLEAVAITRYRLECSERREGDLCYPVQPIVYYVDSGAPEPIRSALVEGASWWVQAFEAAGFRDAVHVQGGVLAWIKQVDPSLPTY